MEIMKNRSISAGSFIVIEGIDGAGKTEMAHRLSEWLVHQGMPCSLVEKKGTDAGDNFVTEHLEQIGNALWHYPREMDLAFLGDAHWLHLLASWYGALDFTRVRPLLNAGQTVIVDGWIYKYILRFALKDDVSMELAVQCFNTLTKPDLVLFLDVDPEIAVRRRPFFSNSELGRFDGETGDAVASFISYQSRVRAQYDDWISQDNWVAIEDCGHGIRPVFDELVVQLGQFFSFPSQHAEA